MLGRDVVIPPLGGPRVGEEDYRRKGSWARHKRTSASREWKGHEIDELTARRKHRLALTGERATPKGGRNGNDFSWPGMVWRCRYINIAGRSVDATSGRLRGAGRGQRVLKSRCRVPPPSPLPAVAPPAGTARPA